jgi:dihydroorotate dehydrogenase electron transfer subunit
VGCQTAACNQHDAKEIALPVNEADCEVVYHDWENAEYKLIKVKGTAAMLTAQPGQFFHLACPGVDAGKVYLRRPMSVYGVDQAQGLVEFLYKVQGEGTKAISELQCGASLNLLGPLGKGFTLPAASQHVVVIARGVGLATLTPLIEQAALANKKVTAILSVRTPALALSKARLEKAGAHVVFVTDAENTSSPEQVAALLAQIHAETAIDFLATCGSNRLLQVMRHFASQHQIAGQVATEQLMGCAMGMCYACVKPFRKEKGSDTLTYKRVCWDGPVFDLEEVVSW